MVVALVLALAVAMLVACGDNLPDAPPDSGVVPVDAEPPPPDAEIPPEICDNDEDDDGDHFADCDDSDCSLEEHCNPEQACNDDEDNDRDGAEDCDDTDCALAVNCLPEGLCSNGGDDDLDGDVDCDDDDCLIFCLAGCTDAETLIVIDATGLPATVDNGTDVVLDFPVTLQGWISGIAVGFTIQHSFPADLDISLRSPDPGPSLDLTSDNGGTGQNYIDTYFSDDASTPVTSGSAPFTGRFRPEEPFTRIVGRPSLGNWQLVVHDDFAGEAGTIEAAAVYVCVCDGTAGCEQHQACLDGVDNDGDSLIDCADPADCGTVAQCTTETACTDDIDNNLNGLTDCQDPGCNGIDGCELPEQTCTDGGDNDDDLLIDCADPDCFNTAHCLAEADCGDGTDDDGDGLADCFDVGCDGVDGCELGTEVSCGDGFDNDGDGAADCADTGCAGLMVCNGISCPAGSVARNRAATGLPGPITDAGTINVPIPLARNGLVKMVAVKLDVTHTADNDLDIFLDAPGASVELTTDTGSTNDNFTATIFIDSATTAITSGTAPFTGQFRPERPLSNLIGLPVQGNWTLRVTDDAGGNLGTLNSYEVLVCQCDADSGDCEFGLACRNGADDDADSLVDCAEASCATDPFCIPEALCNDGIDQDLDGLIDCLDPNCNGIDSCEFGAEVTCNDSKDNDADQLSDCTDPDCMNTAHCLPESNCIDGIDNDNDGLTDCLDVGCNGLSGCELGTEASCGDAFDNDGDGTTDCADSNCAPTLLCTDSCPGGMGKTYLFATDLPQPIVDNATITSTIAVGATGKVHTVAVRVDITHTYDSDLDISLEAPGGTRELSTDNGGSGDHYAGTVFIDSAPTAVTAGTAPFAGRFRPEQPLSGLFGTQLAGDWKLKVGDDTGADVGSLRRFEILACHCDPTTTDCEFTTECRNGTDEDNDGLIDCADPNCATDPFCIPEPICNDGIDQDLDTLVDCRDPDCNGISGCQFGVELSCTDGLDNDGDGPRDCFDTDCAADAACQIELVCNNGLDDDGSGQADCADPNCASNIWCLVESDCQDGVDNDGDGATDCSDVGCNGVQGCLLPPEGPSATCDDGIDNDADLTVDCNDTNCALWCAIPACPAGSYKTFYQGNGVPAAIPDNSFVNPAISTIANNEPGLITQVAARVDITHTNDTHLDIFLGTVNGMYELSTDNGSSGDNYVGTVFVEPAPGRIGTTGFTTPPFTGKFMPETTLAGLVGVQASGSWPLVVFDDTSGEAGQLVNYQLLVCQCDAADGNCEFGMFACRNGIDDDGNGLIDCAEPACTTDASCAAPPPVPEQVCNDGLDDDGDGAMDCADPDCGWVCNALGSVCTGTRQLLRYGVVDLPRTIPTTATSVSNSPFQVTRSGTIVRAAVRFNALHTFDGDLALFLASPAGTIIELTSGNGSSLDNYVNTVFVDTALGVIGSTGFSTAPFTGNYRPEQPLSLLAFEQSAGQWWAQLRDNTASPDGGTWTELALGLCVEP